MSYRETTFTSWENEFVFPADDWLGTFLDISKVRKKIPGYFQSHIRGDVQSRIRKVFEDLYKKKSGLKSPKDSVGEYNNDQVGSWHRVLCPARSHLLKYHRGALCRTHNDIRE